MRALLAHQVNKKRSEVNKKRSEVIMVFAQHGEVIIKHHQVTIHLVRVPPGFVARCEPTEARSR
jgi:hypothetical protein